MGLIKIAVPRRSVQVFVDGVPTLGFHLGRREGKIPARIFGDDLRRFCGQKVVCHAEVRQHKTGRGEASPFVALHPRRTARPTHALPRYDASGAIVFPPLF